MHQASTEEALVARAVAFDNIHYRWWTPDSQYLSDYISDEEYEKFIFAEIDIDAP
jgi:hypothetical protein